MEILLLIIVFIFGTIIGSFLNVVALRFNTGKTIQGRSRCMSCGRQLAWIELIPIISFLIQGGKCRKCKSKISRQYPLVEFLTGVIFVLVYIAFPPYLGTDIFWTIFHLVVGCLLMVISVYDIKHKIIPDRFVYAFILLSFFSIFVGNIYFLTLPSFNAWIAGPVLALPFALIWLISKGTWMGFGDAKLVLGIGWILGLNDGANAIILAFWIAALVSIIWLFVTRKGFRPKTEVPFGPYLIIGMYIVLFYGIQVIDFALFKELILSLF